MDLGTPNDDAQDVQLLLTAYVLGELADDERARVERQLASDPALRAELEAIEAVSLELFAAAAPHEPPPALKDRVFDAIDAIDAAPAPLDELAPARREPAGATRARRRWSLPSFALPALSGALAVGCLLLGFAWLSTSAKLDDRTTQLNDLQATVQQPTTPPTSNVAVNTSGSFATARGRLVRDGDEWVVVFVGVPDPGEGASWQVWTADKQGQIENVAQWTGDERTQVLTLDDADDIDQVMISHEKTTAPVAAPSGDPVASATT